MGERSKIALALCALTLAVYAEVGTHAFVDFDDTKHIAQNPDVAPGWSAERMVRVFTHPHFGDFIPSPTSRSSSIARCSGRRNLARYRSAP